MKQLLGKILFWFYLKWLFFYKMLLHKKRTKTLVSNAFLLRAYQTFELLIVVGTIGMMILIAFKFLKDPR
ncbi:MAG TPA: hypothetical protein PLQ81_04385 [bacterium]|nr:hypothetical protein [bacterium]